MFVCVCAVAFAAVLEDKESKRMNERTCCWANERGKMMLNDKFFALGACLSRLYPMQPKQYHRLKPVVGRRTRANMETNIGSRLITAINITMENEYKNQIFHYLFKWTRNKQMAQPAKTLVSIFKQKCISVCAQELIASTEWNKILLNTLLPYIHHS